MNLSKLCYVCECDGTCQNNPMWKPGPHERTPLTFWQKLHFWFWLRDLRRWCAVFAPMAGDYVDQSGAGSWFGYFKDGFSPRTAMLEDMSYWEN